MILVIVHMFTQCKNWKQSALAMIFVVPVIVHMVTGGHAVPTSSAFLAACTVHVATTFTCILNLTNVLVLFGPERS